MIAARMIEQLGYLARTAGQVELVVHTPTDEVRKLALEVLATVPAAWSPTPHEITGSVTIELLVLGCCVIEWCVYGLPMPEGWTSPASDAAKHKSEQAAGAALMAIATAELTARHRAAFSPAEAN